MSNIRNILKISIITLVIAVSFSSCARREVGEKEYIRQALDLYHEAIDHMEKNEYAEAENKLKKSLEITPRPVVYLELGHILAEQGKYEEAVAEINKAFDLVKNFPAAKAEIDRIIAQRKLASMEGEFISQEKPTPKPVIPDTSKVEPIKSVNVEDIPSPTPIPEKPVEVEQKEAIEPAKPVEVIETGMTPGIKETPKEEIPEVMSCLKDGLKAAQEGAWDEAIAYYKKGLESDPTDSILFYNLGNAYFNTGKIEEAYLSYKDAVHYNPGFSKAWNNLGVIQEQRGFSDESIECYKKSIELNNYLDAHYNLGMLLEKKGRYEEAITHFSEYVKREPDSQWGKKAAEHLKQLHLK